MTLRRIAQATLCGIGLAVVSACDPGYEMHPEGVLLNANHTWSASLVGVTLVGRPLGGLIGETWLSSEFRATNNTDTDFQIDEAVLLVGGQSVSMKRDGVNPSYWAVPAGRKDVPVLVTWDFQDAAPRVLGSECTIMITAHRGDEQGQLTVKYVRMH